MTCKLCKHVLAQVNDKKLRISVFAGILFFLIANPATFKLMSSILGNWVANAGCPTTAGLILHTIVFIIVTRLSMEY